MIRPNRLVVGAALAAALVVASARAADPDKLLPAESDTVVSINLRQLLDSKIFKDYAAKQVEQALEGQDLKKLLTDLGLDPLKDVDRVVMGMAINGANDTRYLMVVYGTFDPQKLFRTAESYTKTEGDKFSMIKDGNTIIFKFQPETGEPPVYGTVVDDRTLIAASDKKLISNALAAHAAGKPAPIKPELAALVKRMDDKSSMYAASLVKGKFDGVNIPENDFIDLSGINKALPKMETMAVTLKIGNDVLVEVTVGLADEDTAGDFKTSVEGVVGQLKQFAGLVGAGEIVNSVKTSLKSKEVTISGKATGADIGKLVRQKN
jgi:hypothetical protein